jgi:hypothetical protein
MLADAGNQLYVGPLIDSVQSGDGLMRRVSTVRRLRVAAQRAATMFSLNVRAWKDQRFVQESYSPVLLAQLEGGLERIAGRRDEEPTVEWGLRQAVFQRLP